LLFSAAAWLWPEVFAPLRTGIVPLLGVVMFGMGITLTPADFARATRRPALLGLGAALQFGAMPLIAFAVARILGLDSQLTAGLVLVGACPGGTASNVICYLARADVALSITLTAVSTCVAVVATPLLTELYVGHAVEVDVLGMIASIFRIVIVPVALGVAVNVWLGARLGALKRVFPLVSVAAICVIIAIVLALSHERPLLGMPESVRRTLAVEVGMQNSGLGVALAVQYFSALAALPGALFSIWHNLTGSLLASLWSRRAPV